MSKASLLAGLRQQTACIRHLALRLNAEQAEFRFSAGQRSTIELLRYLCTQNPGVIDYIITGSWNRWGALEEATKALTVAEIPEALRAQQALSESLLAAWSDERLQARSVTMWWGQTLSMHDAIEATALRFSIGYTMQLFLQAKAAGLSELGSSDLWYGKAKA